MGWHESDLPRLQAVVLALLLRVRRPNGPQGWAAAGVHRCVLRVRGSTTGLGGVADALASRRADAGAEPLGHRAADIQDVPRKSSARSRPAWTPASQKISTGKGRSGCTS